ncbi:MAG: hypothetical protein ABSH38_08955 [Verrucomicrobiota bacterium]|jgi:chromosome segregation ATPase
MKYKAVLILQVLVVLGLGAAWIVLEHRSDEQQRMAASQARREAAAAQLAKVEADAKTNAEATAAQVARLDQQIQDLEAHHQNLDTQSADLHNSITELDAQIKDIKRKLAGAIGDRELLANELKQLQAKKAALEKDFNDLATVRKQLRKVKAEIVAARQRDWIRRGVYASFNQKGGERLVHPVVVLPPNTNSTWNVELQHGGSVTDTTPDSANAPAPQ